MDSTFGTFIKTRREALKQEHGSHYSLRSVAERVGVTAGYLSRVENGAHSGNSKGDPTATLPTEEKANALADDLGLDRNVTLALAGLVSSELKAIILKRPVLFAEMLNALKDQPDTAILKVVREVRDGEW